MRKQLNNADKKMAREKTTHTNMFIQSIVRREIDAEHVRYLYQHNL